MEPRDEGGIKNHIFIICMSWQWATQQIKTDTWQNIKVCVCLFSCFLYTLAFSFNRTLALAALYIHMVTESFQTLYGMSRRTS